MAISFVLGNFLPPGAYGQYIALLLLASTVAILVAMPIDSAAIHYILKSKNQREQNCYYSAGTFIVLVNGAIVCLVLITGKSIFQSIFKLGTVGPSTYAAVIAVSIAIVIYAFYGKLMTVRFLFKEQIVVLLVGAVAQFSVIIYLIKTDTANPSDFLIASLVFYAIGIACYEYRLRKEFSYTLQVEKDAHVRPLIRFSSLVYLGALTGFLDEKIDMLCINAMLNKEQLAYYSYVMLFGFSLYGIGLGVSQVTFPLFCQNFHKNDLASCELTYQRTLNYLFLVISFVGLALVYNGHLLITFLLPVEYLAILPVLSIIIPGMTLFAVFAGVGTLLTAAGKPQYGLWLVASFMVINLILNIVLIPQFGILGAAVATSTTFLARSLTGHWLNKRVIGIHYRIDKLFSWYVVMIILVAIGPYLHIVMREIILVFFFILAGCSLTDTEERTWLRSLITRPNLI